MKLWLAHLAASLEDPGSDYYFVQHEINNFYTWKLATLLEGAGLKNLSQEFQIKLLSFCVVFRVLSWIF